MAQRLIKNSQFTWIDVVDPSPEELQKLAETYQLPPEQVKDCLIHGHLPKFEESGKFQFIILRSFEPDAEKKSDTIEALTRKLGIFYHDGFALTVHRRPWPYLDSRFEKWEKADGIAAKSSMQIVSELFYGVAKSYEGAVDDAYSKFYEFEQDVFGQDKKVRLSFCYLLKRRVSIMKRMLRMNLASIHESIDETNSDVTLLFANARDYIHKLLFQLDEIHEGLTSLLNLQVTLASQKTNEASFRANEVMRVLTIISVFIMPMNLIASIYGMNFTHMPELQWLYGYPIAILLMASVGLGVYFWFRNKGWLKGI